MLRACCAHNWINLQMRLARLVSKANQKSVSEKIHYSRRFFHVRVTIFVTLIKRPLSSGLVIQLFELNLTITTNV